MSRHWIDFLQEHQYDITILCSNQVLLENIGYTKEQKYLDHIITFRNGLLWIEEYFHESNEYIRTWPENSIRDYLGY